MRWFEVAVLCNLAWASTAAGKKSYKLVLVQGDNEKQTEGVKRIATAALANYGRSVETIPTLLGAKAIQQTGSAVPPETIKQILEHKDAVRGGTAVPSERPNKTLHEIESPSANVELRKKLDTDVQVRPVKSNPFHFWTLLPRHIRNTDIVFVRPLTQGIGAGLTRVDTTNPANKKVYYTAMVSEDGAKHLAKVAFHTAQIHPSKRIYHFTKRNVMPEFFDPYRDALEREKHGHPDIELVETSVSVGTAGLAEKPNQWNGVIVGENLLMDIESDMLNKVAGGSMGVGGSLSMGTKTGVLLGEPVGETGPEPLNPVGVLRALSHVLMERGRRLNDPSLTGAALDIEDAIHTSLRYKSSRTPDVNGHATTNGVIDVIERRLIRRDVPRRQ